MSQSVVVIDYGIGNVFSVCNALRKIGASPVLTNDPKLIANADRLVLPVENLKKNGLDNAIYDFVATRRPFLGICIGMQLLMDSSSENGFHKGLGLISGTVEEIKDNFLIKERAKVPHIGWSEVSMLANQKIPITSVNSNHFYFVHSYVCVPSRKENIIGLFEYSGAMLTAIVRKNNIFGVQFHPERSGNSGLSFLKDFIEI